MGVIEFLLDFILHIDVNLNLLINTYGLWVYLVIFLVVFCETGLVVTPFLPGDSLIFIAGALANQGSLNIGLLFMVFALAAFMGDAVNYSIGSYLGPKVFHEENSRFLNRKYLDMAQEFYNKYGGKTIFVARFVPIVRTFAPFLAGVGRMGYPRFALSNILGGVTWVAVFLVSGYLFGGFQIVKDNLSLILIGIIVVTMLPTVVKVLQIQRESKSD